MNAISKPDSFWFIGFRQRYVRRFAQWLRIFCPYDMVCWKEAPHNRTGRRTLQTTRKTTAPSGEKS
jgi:hypothetical protein